MQPISVIFTLPEDDLGAVSSALSAGPVHRHRAVARRQHGARRGTLTLVDNQIDPDHRHHPAQGRFPTRSNTLWPGQFVNARVLVRTERSALTMPTAAVQRGPNGLFAYVVKPDSTVEVRPLKVGRGERRHDGRAAAASATASAW